MLVLARNTEFPLCAARAEHTHFGLIVRQRTSMQRSPALRGLVGLPAALRAPELDCFLPRRLGLHARHSFSQAMPSLSRSRPPLALIAVL
jgi:hypothetical protein